MCTYYQETSVLGFPESSVNRGYPQLLALLRGYCIKKQMPIYLVSAAQKPNVIVLVH